MLHAAMPRIDDIRALPLGLFDVALAQIPQMTQVTHP